MIVHSVLPVLHCMQVEHMMKLSLQEVMSKVVAAYPSPPPSPPPTQP